MFPNNNNNPQNENEENFNRRRRRNQPENDNNQNMVERLIKDVPPITRLILISVLIVGVLHTFDILSPMDLFYSPKMIFQKGQFWRIVTCFLYFDRFSINFIITIYFIYFYCSKLEVNSFQGKTADFLFFMIFGSFFLLIFAHFLGLPFCSNAMLAYFIYVWARRNPWERVALYGVISLSAAYLPFVMLGLSVMFAFSNLSVAISNQMVDKWTVLSLIWSLLRSDILGYIVGHLYYFFKDIVTVEYNVDILKTPRIFELMFSIFGFESNQPADNDENQRQVIDEIPQNLDD